MKHVRPVNMICVATSWDTRLMEPADRLRHAIEHWLAQDPARRIDHFARRVGKARSTINAHMNGQNNLRPAVAREYARALSVTPEFLLYGTANTSETDTTIELPLVGFVSAGIAEVYIDQQETQAPPEVLKIRLGGDRLSAVVRGDSMTPRFMPGERLIFGPPGNPADMLNMEVMAQIEGGPIAVKVLRRGSSPDCWTLASHNPAHLPLEDVQLLWARPFEGMIR
jgi:phage repressor protein C with HTH and peptisase S24 domain